MSGQRQLRAWVSATCAAAALAASCFAGVGDFRDHGRGAAIVELERAALERGQPIKGKILLPEPVSPEKARASIRVSDSLGRLLVEASPPLPKGQAVREIPFELAVPGVLAQRHYVNATVKASAPAKGTHSASAELIYSPPKEWDDYICTIWHRHNAKRIPYLQEMYLSGSQWTGSSSHLPDHFIDHNYRYYLETGAVWAFAPYHMWMPDKPKTYYHKQAKAAFMKDRTDFRNLERNPCLSNHAIRRRIEWIFTHEARMHRHLRPLYYTVADEPGIANQAAPFDYCFSPHCKAAFREWAKQRYGTLEALNRQWGSDFAAWDDVRGATTDEILARNPLGEGRPAGGENFSAWCDHKDFMDSVLIDAYALAKQSVRRHDPDGRIGMGGAQGPAAVGGWDFWKLCRVFDVLEAYYIGNNYELMRSFNPDLIPFHASFAPGDPAKHLLWYLFIHGDRGLLVWDEGSKYVDDKGQYSPRAKEATGWYRELTGGIGKLRIASRRVDDPIALYHSQANLRVHWLLEVRPAGEDWIKRDSWHERINSRYFRLRESWVKLIEDNGFQYRFLCPAQVAAGELKPFDPATGAGFKVLILPEMAALSDAEVDAIEAFVKAGGTVIADRPPGEFDEHGKRRGGSPLAKLFDAEARAVLLNREMLPYYQQRIFPGERERALKDLVGDHLRKIVGEDRATPEVVGPDGKCVTGVETTLWQNGHAELIALHRNPLLRIHELGPQEYKSNRKFETPVELTIRGRGTKAWIDVRAGKALGQGKEVTVTLPPFEPVFLAALPSPPEPFTAAVRGGKLLIAPGRPCAMDTSVYHLAMIGPDGKERLVYRTNVAVRPGGESMPLPLALNDAKGAWTIKIREVATGAEDNVVFDHK